MKITHPFHPCQGKTYKILNKIKITKDDILIVIQEPTIGNLAVPIEWTDKSTPDLYNLSRVSSSFFSIDSLIDLIELVKQLKIKKKQKKG